MNILMADKFPAEQLEQLQGLGHTCEYAPDLSSDNLSERISGNDVLVVRSTRVEAATIEAADQLKLIIRAGSGTNTIDKACAAEKDIPVCNIPGKNAIAVAELTMGLLIAIDRKIPDNVAELRSGRWNKGRYANSRGLYGQRMGIVGMGVVGMAVAERAHAFGLQLYMIEKPGRSDVQKLILESLGVTAVVDLLEMASKCDIVSFHVPGAASTRNLVNKEFLAQMKEGAILLNTSRGEVVDEDALLDALDTKGIRAGLDVYANEPAASKDEFVSRLAQHPNVYGTHHIGASTAQAQNAVAEEVVTLIEALKEGKMFNCVNL